MGKKTKAIKETDIKGKKPWLKKKRITQYKVEKLERRKTFLIVCEGQTEELYFKSFPVVNAHVKCFALGYEKSALIECAINMAKEDDYDEVWCVFDMDIKPGNDKQFETFDNAIAKAETVGIHCAYSNDAFELWFILHYQFIDQEQLRTYYFERLSQFWKVNYEKNGKKWEFASKIYGKLIDDGSASQELAIKNAERLFEIQRTKAPHRQNPVTLVYKLVQALNVYLRQ